MPEVSPTLSITLAELSEILSKYDEVGSVLLESRGEAVEELLRVVGERREMEQFVEAIWRMKDSIEPGPE